MYTPSSRNILLSWGNHSNTCMARNLSLTELLGCASFKTTLPPINKVWPDCSTAYKISRPMSNRRGNREDYPRTQIYSRARPPIRLFLTDSGSPPCIQRKVGSHSRRQLTSSRSVCCRTYRNIRWDFSVPSTRINRGEEFQTTREPGKAGCIDVGMQMHFRVCVVRVEIKFNKVHEPSWLKSSADVVKVSVKFLICIRFRCDCSSSELEERAPATKARE